MPTSPFSFCHRAWLMAQTQLKRHSSEDFGRERQVMAEDPGAILVDRRGVGSTIRVRTCFDVSFGQVDSMPALVGDEVQWW